MPFILVLAVACGLFSSSAISMDDASNDDGDGTTNFSFNHVSGLFRYYRGRPIYLPNVDMDRYYVVRGRHPALATRGIATCIAVCGVGKVNDESVLALGHVSVLISAECALSKITHELRAQGCPSNTIKIYLIGGKSDEGLDEEQQEFCQLAEHFNISGTLFNPLTLESENAQGLGDNSDEDQYVNVVLMPHAVFFGQNFDFMTMAALDGCGYDDWADFY